MNVSRLVTFQTIKWSHRTGSVRAAVDHCPPPQTCVDSRIAGWSHGTLDEFTYVGMEMHNPNSASDKVSPRTAKKSFEQDFLLGDHGYPCTTGRKSTLLVYCGQAGDTCTNIPGVQNQNCLDESTATSGKFCMCDAAYDPSTACSANITLLLIDCPSVFISPTGQNSPSSGGEPLSGGAVFGIIVLV